MNDSLSAHSPSADHLKTLSLAQIRALREDSANRGRPARGLRLSRQERRDFLPLSYAQERIWFLEQFGHGNSTYLMPHALKLDGPLNITALERSLGDLVRRHESLRTGFQNIDGTPVQVISPPRPVSIKIHDISTLPATELADKVRELRTLERQTSFDLSCAPLIRCSLIKIAENSHILQLSTHHIVSDGWSRGILFRDLSELYTAYLHNHVPSFIDLPIQYADYAICQREWLQGDTLETHLKYWRHQLDDAPTYLNLHTDKPRPPLESFRGATLAVDLPSPLLESIKNIACAEGATLFMATLAAFYVLLSRWSGQQDIVVGTPVAGRSHRALEGLVGCFVNMLALRTVLSPTLTYRQLLSNVKDTTLDGYSHQEIPFEMLVKDLRPERTVSRQPIFQVVFAVQNFPEQHLSLPGVTAASVDTDWTYSQFDLAVHLHEQRGQASAIFQYAADLFEEGTIRRISRQFTQLLTSIANNPDAIVSTLSMLDPDEIYTLTYKWNGPESNYPHDRCIHHLFSEHVERTPYAPALVFKDDVISYEELDRRANVVARRLANVPIIPDSIIGIYLERGIDLIVAMLGVLKVGGAYLPLDPTHPNERTVFLLKETSARAIVTSSHLAASLSSEGYPVVCTDPVFDRDESQVKIHTDVSADNLAYVLHTSGSTGQPKGVGVSHRSVNRLFFDTNYIDLSPHDVFLHLSAPAFDASTFEIWGALCRGATLVLYPDPHVDSTRLGELIARHKVSVLLLITGLFHQFIDAAPRQADSLRHLLVGGDVLSTRHLRLALSLLPRCQITNVYGPTESTTFSTFYPSGNICPSVTTIPIGRPVSNTSTYVLNEQLALVPIGAPGELYVGGDGVARGYINRPELTAERFLASPYGTPGSRLYRTGDLVRHLPNGDLEFLGRIDGQVKIRGFRVELGEIEARLLRHSKVKEAVVMVRNDNAGDKRLAAYIVPRATPHTNNGNGIPSSNDISQLAAELHDYLSDCVPDYMVPSAWTLLDTIPLTATGKVDRRALPAPKGRLKQLGQFVAPRTEFEKSLVTIWEEVLQAENLGVHDNFFDAGGHSLAAIKALFQINRLTGLALSVLDLYRAPTIHELVSRINGVASEDEPLNLEWEATLREPVVVNEVTARHPPKEIFLTGATGFMGRHLVAQLLHDTDAKIVCLIRASSVVESVTRLRDTLIKWELWEDRFKERLRAVPGDLRSPRFGLDEATYENVCAHADSVYHCATSMNHLETYSMAKPANVTAVQDLLRLATHRKQKLVNYISTIGVFAPVQTASVREVHEDTPIDQETHWSSRGYTASKWVGEQIVLAARKSGLPCNVFRLGLVWADTRYGRYDELQREYRLLKSCLLSGFGIKDYRYDLPPTPVDYVSRAIVSLSSREWKRQGTFHLSSPRDAIAGLFECCNQITDRALTLLPLYEWVCKIKALHLKGISMPIVPLIEFAFSMNESTFYERLRRTQAHRLKFSCEKTYRELELEGITTPIVTADSLRLCLQSMLTKDSDLRSDIDGMLKSVGSNR